jgi:DNA anti-recombination protein RmuC
MEETNKKEPHNNSDKQKDESLVEILAEQLEQAAAELKEKYLEERKKRQEIKELKTNLISSFDREVADYADHVEKKFASSNKDALQQELEDATNAGDLNRIQDILKRLSE